MLVNNIRSSDILLAGFVLAITGMLLVPLPTPLLDILLAFNLSVSLLLLLVSLYMPNALALLAFPALLLLTTLFRLGLNVASTRLILLQADAGRIIEAFGTFLIRGEAVVGIIIFIIITVVNFIVVARGASRVSEVAARFALDALPGKQMAIDAELRSGIISADEARNKREDLRKESQLYGAMDGAMKFVQGDVIAGLFIIATNIIGGLYLGVSRGASFNEAVATYTRLTVGDGLVSQIPALLISICAGIVVTRVSSGENTTLGSDVGSQLFARPGTIVFCGLLLFFVAALPDMPKFPFVLVGGFMLGAGLWLRRKAGAATGQLLAARELGGGGTLLLAGASEDEASTDSGLQFLLDAAVLYKSYRLNTVRYRGWWKQLQIDFFNETGVQLPEFRVIPDETLSSGEYRVYAAGGMIEGGFAELDAILAEVKPDSSQLLGLVLLREAKHPICKTRVAFVANTSAARQVLEAARIRSFDFFEVIGLKIAAFYLLHPEELLTLAEVHGMLKQLEKKHPGLVADAIHPAVVNTSRMTELMQELIRQRINVREIRQVIESVASFCSMLSTDQIQEGDIDFDALVAHVRISKRRHLLARLLSARGTLRVITLSHQVEELLEEAASEGASRLPAIDPDSFDTLSQGMSGLGAAFFDRGIPPVTILCKGILRAQVTNFARACSSPLPVISFDELEPTIRVEEVGVWNFEAGSI